MPRLVVPAYRHHVVQRGNRRQKTFFSADDYRRYIDIIAAAKADSGADIWAWCLMPNHVHLVVVPERRDSLAALFANAHRKYTRYINARQGWRGHLWQERFHSCVMDEHHLTNPGFQPFAFAGGRYDNDTGLTNFGLREYDTVSAQWTVKDPIGFAGSAYNQYAYVAGDPVNRIDPMGTDGIPTSHGLASGRGPNSVSLIPPEGNPPAQPIARIYDIKHNGGVMGIKG